MCETPRRNPLEQGETYENEEEKSKTSPVGEGRQMWWMYFVFVCENQIKLVKIVLRNLEGRRMREKAQGLEPWFSKQKALSSSLSTARQ